MTNEELNTALYKKMFAEQDEFRSWLLVQTPEEILRHAYDYVMREDILLSLEYNDLSDRYASVLLDMDKPLAAIFSKLEHTDSPHMEHVWDCVEQCAKDTLEAQQMTGLPIYPHSAAYAREHDELPVYRASYQANVDCSKAIDAAIREHYSDNRLNSAAVKRVVDWFGLTAPSWCWLLLPGTKTVIPASAMITRSGRPRSLFLMIRMSVEWIARPPMWWGMLTLDWSICSCLRHGSRNGNRIVPP